MYFANSWEDALLLIRTGVKPHLILSDINMPGWMSCSCWAIKKRSPDIVVDVSPVKGPCPAEMPDRQRRARPGRLCQRRTLIDKALEECIGGYAQPLGFIG
jgi:hypothetical protein